MLTGAGPGHAGAGELHRDRALAVVAGDGVDRRLGALRGRGEGDRLVDDVAGRELLALGHRCGGVERADRRRGLGQGQA